MTVFNLPDLGEGLDEAEIVAWYVNEGDHVTADQPLVSVETRWLDARSIRTTS